MPLGVCQSHKEFWAVFEDLGTRTVEGCGLRVGVAPGTAGVPRLSRGWPVCLTKHNWLKACFEIPALCYNTRAMVN